MIKAVGFDLDETLVHLRKDYIYDVVGKTVLKLGKPANEEFAREFWYGSNRDDLIQKELGIIPYNFWKIFRKYDTPHSRAAHIEVYEDVGALKSLHAREIKLGIVTGSLTEVANVEIQKIREKFEDIEFDSIIANNPDARIKQKPHPDTLLMCLQELKIKNDELIYVGDSKDDVEAATRAEITPVVVLRDESRREEFGDSVKIINSLYEIERML